MTVKFMNSKDHCYQCGNKTENKNKEGQTFCDTKCEERWIEIGKMK